MMTKNGDQDENGEGDDSSVEWGSMVFAALAALWLGGFTQIADQGKLVGAREVIREIQAKNPATSLQRREQAILDSVDAYGRQSDRMTPSQAAIRWLALVDRGLDLPRHKNCQ